MKNINVTLTGLNRRIAFDTIETAIQFAKNPDFTYAVVWADGEKVLGFDHGDLDFYTPEYV